MTSFASLMAMSATQTQRAQQAVESQLQERKRKEALQRKQQEEREAKEREQEKKLRMKRLEEDRRQQERMQRLEAERKAKEAALQRREDEQRDALRYGPKKAAKMAAPANSGSKHTSSSSDSRETTRKRRDADDSDQESGVVLTREELRRRKQQQEMRKLFHGTKKPSHSAGRSYGKTGLRLPGGAVNIVTNQGAHGAGEFQPDVGSGSVRERLAAQPNTLVMLNTKKRDKRTEDEIQMEVRAARKVLEGADATQFNDWFGDKKKEVSKRSSPSAAVPSSPPSRPDTPAPRSNGHAATPAHSIPTSQKHDSRAPKPNAFKGTPAPVYKSAGGASSRAGSYDMGTTSLPPSKFPKINKVPSKPTALHRPSSSNVSAPVRSKRPRSPSFSDSPSPPPVKKRSTRDEPTFSRDEIWQIVGRRNRDEYISRVVDSSDDEDMEADTTALEREEKKSARIAREEDERAQEEEHRREMEKRQRKKEKERAASRGR